jgi:hypothetical protein
VRAGQGALDTRRETFKLSVYLISLPRDVIVRDIRVAITTLLVLLGIAAAGLQSYRAWMRLIPPPSHIAPNAFARLATAAGRIGCEDRSYCLIVYVTPWCSECHLQADVIRLAHQKLQATPEIGLAIIIGGDERLELQLMEENLGVPALLDIDGSFRSKAGIRSFPKWLIVEQNGAVLQRFTRLSEFDHYAAQKELAVQLKPLLDAARDSVVKRDESKRELVLSAH